jgi:hypothetical protein|nr:MAG TPA: hypothetical protein [Caudoviricetes sp.]
MKNKKVVNIFDNYIALTNEDLFKLVPIFAGFIDMGRMQYRLDETSDALTEKVVNYWIKQKRKETFNIVK